MLALLQITDELESCVSRAGIKIDGLESVRATRPHIKGELDDWPRSGRNCIPGLDAGRVGLADSGFNIGRHRASAANTSLAAIPAAAGSQEQTTKQDDRELLHGNEGYAAASLSSRGCA